MEIKSSENAAVLGDPQSDVSQRSTDNDVIFKFPADVTR